MKSESKKKAMAKKMAKRKKGRESLNSVGNDEGEHMYLGKDEQERM